MHKSVFLGYSSNQKGYKCFDPVTKKYFVTMDVQFFENQSFFKSLSGGEQTDKQVSNWAIPIYELDFLFHNSFLWKKLTSLLHFPIRPVLSFIKIKMVLKIVHLKVEFGKPTHCFTTFGNTRFTTEYWDS